ncbi:MAG: polyphosphate kinase 2 family protein [Armatimonadetes bacterium]|nr:polyphosphate kinase 2 family protein [Armatimonadota bacterium]
MPGAGILILFARRKKTVPYTYKLDHPQKARLSDYDPDYHAGMRKEEAEEELAYLRDELADLQELLYGAGTHSVLIVLQGRDTSGKDGTIKHVMANINPQGCQVTSFKAPTPDELAHDFLWRIHRHTPAKGMIGIFNRSHYEDVLVVRVHRLAPESVWKKRFDHIDDFERMLADHNTILIKLCLHISKNEQKERLLAREEDPAKAWKLAAGDWQERPYWDAYTEAYEDALGRCASLQAPWHIVPANHKWFRNLAVAHTLVETLQPYRQEWQSALDETGRKALAELRGVKARLGEG